MTRLGREAGWVAVCAGLAGAGLLWSGCSDDGATTETEGESILSVRGGPGRTPVGRPGPVAHNFHGHSRYGRHFFSGHQGHGGTCGGGAGTGHGAGGSGGSPALTACLGSSPSGAALTGSASTPVGGPFTYAAPNLTAPSIDPLLSTDGSTVQGWHVTANPGVTTDPSNAWTGVGVGFGSPACLDARAYTGIRFTISGNLGTCGLSFLVVPSEDNAVANGTVGTCTAGSSCLSPSFGPVTAGTTIVHFADLSGGNPLATVDPAALNALAWQINVPTNGSPACNADFIITDVSFVNDTPRAACVGSPPASPVITDFSDAFSTGPGAFAFADGGTFTYASVGQAPPTLSLVSSDGTAAGQALSVAFNTGTPLADAAAVWDGFGLYFNMCTDASRYSGISFTINGNLGACPLQFSAQFSEDDDVASDPSFGSCTAATCYPPSLQPVGVGTTTVRFADLTGGNPLTTVDAARLTGVHWQVSPPTGAAAASCSANFTIDDVSFVP
jgi:hypothetical protein